MEVVPVNIENFTNQVLHSQPNIGTKTMAPTAEGKNNTAADPNYLSSGRARELLP